MKILLTGANGFVGSHIAETLTNNGHKVTCLVRKTSDCKWIKDFQVDYFVGDLTQIDKLTDLISNIDVIVHSAAVLRAFRKETYYEINQTATKKLVESVLKNNPRLKKFIYISSQAAMGPSTANVPKRNSERETPISDYGKSKLAGEKELEILKDKIPYTILRPSSIYGPRDRDIFIFFNLVKFGIAPKPLQDRYIQLLYVKDLAIAVSKAIQNSSADYQTYFLAENKRYSWNDVSKTIAESISNNQKTLNLPLPNFVMYTVALFCEVFAVFRNKPAVLNFQKVKEMVQSFWIGDSDDACKDLGMDFTKLENGAKITYQWYKENNWL